MQKPLLSIVIVARNTAPFADAALLSARAQTLREIEIVFVDDGSIDGTRQIARSHAAQDQRLRVLAGPRKGLSAVRNASLQAARGAFAVVLDSDDMLHPRHCELLLAAQKVHGHEVCASNMIEFAVEKGGLQVTQFACGTLWDHPRDITAEEYLRRGMLDSKDVSPGYLKPLFDMAFLRRRGLAYDETLRIGEDFDLVLRALLKGARMRFLPQATYFYRRHAMSTSFRLALSDCEGLLDATRRYRVDPELRPCVEARQRNLVAAIRHQKAVSALKRGRVLHALRLIAADPTARRMTGESLTQAVMKRLGRFSPLRVGDGSLAASTRAEADRLQALIETSGVALTTSPLPSQDIEAVAVAAL